MIDHKTSSIRHKKQRLARLEDHEKTNHTKLKSKQIHKIMKTNDNRILELFPGNGKLTRVWQKFGTVEANLDRDAFLLFHLLIYLKKKYSVIDLDPYGYPSRFFPDIFLLIEHGFIFMTFPQPGINVLNGIKYQHFLNYYDAKKPTLNQIVKKIKKYGLCHWRKLELIDVVKINRVYRLCFSVERVKANIYTNSRNN